MFLSVSSYLVDMDPQEKRLRNRRFIASSNFTEATFTLLALFNRNAQNLLNTIVLEGVLLDRIEKGEIEHGLPDDVLLETKHFIMIDCLAKIMMLIEGFFALCEAISNPNKGYRSIPKSMAYYKASDIDSFIERFKREEVSVWELVRFPEISKLNLNHEEANFLKRLFTDSCALLSKTITDLIDFYECNRIAYNKLKHGLSMLAGMKMMSPKGIEFPSTVIYALDRWRNRKPRCLCHKSGESLMPSGLEWYDTITLIPYWQHTFRKHSSIMTDLRLLIEYLTTNHLHWASNCGEDYFPLKRKAKGQFTPMIYLSYKLEGSMKEQFEHVVKKITDNMNIAEIQVTFNFNLPDRVMRKILSCFKTNSAATIWAPPSEKTTSVVKVE